MSPRVPKAVMLHGWAIALLLLGLAAGCGPPAVRPAAYPDPEVACPGGRLTWSLQILDQRASREGELKMVAAVRNALQKSFPGCHWTGPEEPAAPTITLEIHRFASTYDGGSWEAAVEWTVSARTDGGSVLAFEANEEVSRPNYRGSNNEQESLSEAFHRALERTVKGLRAMSTAGILRPLQGTPAPMALGLRRLPKDL